MRLAAYRRFHQISIHAPARGATPPTRRGCSGRKFQSTLPRGERQGTQKTSSLYLSISIHAPARGATDFSRSFRTFGLYFNPRSREGSDQPPSLSQSAISNFNPRSREGSDGCSVVFLRHPSYFNPRSREGSDYCTHSWNFSLVHISIHAPARGAT